MSEFGEFFFTSVGCMDGRVQAPVAEFGREKFGAFYPDTITEPGLVGLLAHNPSEELLKSLKKKLLISLKKHNSTGIIVHGHAHCAGNPVEDEEHKQDVLRAVGLTKSLIEVPIIIVPVFVYPLEDGWTCEEISHTMYSQWSQLINKP